MLLPLLLKQCNLVENEVDIADVAAEGAEGNKDGKVCERKGARSE